MKIAKGVLITALIKVIELAIDWLFMCGLIALVCICFEWQFTLKMATGVYIILSILNYTFCHSSHESKN